MRSEGYCSCPVGMYVCVSVYMCVYLSVRSFLSPRASRPRNIGTYVFTVTQERYRILSFTKNASFRSYGVICLPLMPPTTLKPQMTDTKGRS